MTANYLYCIRLPDRRAYIGITDDPHRRFYEHARGDYLVGHAIRKYEPHNCLVEILRAGPRFDILDLEHRWIRLFNTGYPAGYNYAPRLSFAEAQEWFLENLNDSSHERNDADGLDAIFAPAMSLEMLHNGGWIEMTANRRGMRAIEHIFPGLAFDWQRLPCPWKGWWSNVSHLPRVAAKCGRSLRSELIALSRLQALDDAKLASLMACATHDKGVRAAWRPSGRADVHSFFRKIHAHAG